MGLLSAGAICLVPSPLHASLADVFVPGPRVDLAIELDYRTRFLSPGAATAASAAAGGIGRERLDDSRARVARAYLDRLGDELADELIEQVPLLSLLEARYRRHASLRLAGDDPDAADETLASVMPHAEPGVDDRFSLRLRVNAIGDGFDLAPGLHLVRGLLEWRLAYRPFTERIEMTARRPLSDRLTLELTGGQSTTRGGPEVRLDLTWSF
ncbi:MAG TPA: hypothetical protein VF406_00735 [Thermodesulfobacteriota bacterium]